MGVDACLCFMFPSAMCVDFLAYNILYIYTFFLEIHIAQS